MPTTAIEIFERILGDKARFSYIGRGHKRLQVIVKTDDQLAPGDIKQLPAAAAMVFGGAWQLETSWTDVAEFGFKIFVIHKQTTQEGKP